MKSVRLYSLIFYQIYAWGRRAHGLGDLPGYNAALGLSLLATMNVFSVAMATEFIPGGATIGANAKFIAVGVWLAFLGLHFIFFLRDDRVSLLAENFEDQPPTATAMTLAWTYPIGSLLAFLSLLALR